MPSRPRLDLRPLLLLLATAALLAGCAYPRVVNYYDEDCQMMARKMVLDTTEMGVLENCSNEQCLMQLVVGAAVAATSTVVSGSIVLVGNVIYWQERQRKCRRQAEPAA
jgi:hypothetical protein